MNSLIDNIREIAPCVECNRSSEWFSTGCLTGGTNNEPEMGSDLSMYIQAIRVHRVLTMYFFHAESNIVLILVTMGLRLTEVVVITSSLSFCMLFFCSLVKYWGVKYIFH